MEGMKTIFKDKHGVFIHLGSVLEETYELDGKIETELRTVVWIPERACIGVDQSFKKDGSFYEPLFEYVKTSDFKVVKQ